MGAPNTGDKRREAQAAARSHVLEPVGANATRLIARGRGGIGIGLIYNTLLMEIPHFLMERKMMLGIKTRAERR